MIDSGKEEVTGSSVVDQVAAAHQDEVAIEADGELIGTGSISVSVLPAAIEFKI